MPVLHWRERAHGLAPGGVVGAGPVARALLGALLQRQAAAAQAAQAAHAAQAAAPSPQAADPLQGLRVTALPSLLVVLGQADDLPWVDGVRYCAPDPGAPGLWLPTWLAPAPPPDLLHEALRRRAGHAALLLWPSPELVLGLDNALPLHPPVLAWLEQVLA